MNYIISGLVMSSYTVLVLITCDVLARSIADRNTNAQRRIARRSDSSDLDIS